MFFERNAKELFFSATHFFPPKLKSVFGCQLKNSRPLLLLSSNSCCGLWHKKWNLIGFHLAPVLSMCYTTLWTTEAKVFWSVTWLDSFRLWRGASCRAMIFCLSRPGLNPGTDLGFFGSELQLIYSHWMSGFFFFLLLSCLLSSLTKVKFVMCNLTKYQEKGTNMPQKRLGNAHIQKI